MKLLLIEDEKDLTKTLKKGLKEAGYNVDVAYDGESGVFMAITGAYDCIILDLKLPKKDGLEVCREIRKNKITTPILMLTVVDSVDMKVKCLDAGADDYLTKPFSFSELLARIRALTRRSKVVPSVIQVYDLVINPISRTVTRGGKKIYLSPKEFELLYYLAMNQGKVLTRMEIGENVWGINFDTGTNYIDVYINYLRRKIDKDFDKKLIHTVRGVGYVLKAE
ncbi:DNA-binding response regulator, OmpR family, contains REC and winged-helix (wHTH) domain [Candidatus Kryptonium thompsonii]|jgi:DNA-binding response OmpR family regulator|uniref:DNA-binding response regulator, OmpR family, contains REC and winged-helix (WHTH) domain n=2 Tax=Candidatus Kryptonium thompsonii TaxID=1633631 RepID=A0A0P1P6K5_9BACT|nr:response regulator transcription factor [Candidatus Kryptonium thompsoni]CUS82654.1 DNA-binding response regulator, OmpR family, contains REC and winged-helix (wHTH) domain [Candidatus Kryptonium thompsoni]CUS84460.1 DNA-binding response regulator, OmpR family, contains REC and winged-helix (wHTH) domain [Candidatus Kryptonium thompsoni]CUS85400.1 DNA-binding response regulator, OmpR family, contains REC and winged-helix (wHTH) domain [Candidatus Kryptonium thompsoni]CUS86620.1 DNA-binding r